MCKLHSKGKVVQPLQLDALVSFFLFGMQAVRCLAAPDMLEHQLLLQPGLVPGLMALLSAQHLSALAAWNASAAPSQPSCGAERQPLPVQITNLLHDVVLHAHPSAARDILQVTRQPLSDRPTLPWSIIKGILYVQSTDAVLTQLSNVFFRKL